LSLERISEGLRDHCELGVFVRFLADVERLKMGGSRVWFILEGWTEGKVGSGTVEKNRIESLANIPYLTMIIHFSHIVC
jgi:hypothetical protein